MEETVVNFRFETNNQNSTLYNLLLHRMESQIIPESGIQFPSITLFVHNTTAAELSNNYSSFN